MKTRTRALFFTLSIAAFALTALFGLGSLFDRSNLHAGSFKPFKQVKHELKKSRSLGNSRLGQVDSVYLKPEASNTEPMSNSSKADTIAFAAEEQIVLLEEPTLDEESIHIDSTDYSILAMEDSLIEIDTSDLPK